MIDHEIRCEFDDLETGTYEDACVGFAARNDLEAEVARHASILGARYSIMPKQRGRYTWTINEPGLMRVKVYSRKIDDEC